MIGIPAYLGLKIWLKNQKMDKNSNPTKRNLKCPFWLKSITCQPIELESCSNPLKDLENLVLWNKKTFQILDVAFFVDAYMMGVCLCIFCLYWDDIIGPWTPTPQAIFLTEGFLGTRLQHES